MSELEAEVTEGQGEPTLPGLTLHKERLQQGLTVAEVAHRLNLTESAINSLEADNYAALPGVTFVRGYIRSYARLLGLNADQLAMQYGETSATTQVKPLPVLSPERRRRPRSRFMLLGLVLFVVALAVAGYLALEEQGSRRIVQSDEQEPVFSRLEMERADGTLHVQSLDDLDARTARMPVAEINLDALQLNEAGDSLPQTEASSAATGDDVADEAGHETDDQVAASLPPVSTLQLVFNEECWIRVTDVHGEELTSGLKPAGTTLMLDGEGPFELHLGNARGMRILFKGQEVDFQDSIRGNVARIKLG